jgi:branched-chain amino acid transport system ATP-binding protein
MTDPVLQTRNISKSFGALKASDAISLDLRHGEIHALIGPNGAGKSTLIKQIAGSLTPDEGQILLNGADVTQLGRAKRARLGIARTFQVSALAMEDTVLQNTLLGVIGAQSTPYQFFQRALSLAELRNLAVAALERVGLSDQMNMRASELSHGQRRQLEVAIALSMDPKVFIMDEPMAGLGAEGTQALTKLLDSLRHDAPILLIEHDMDAVFALADRISVLVYGKIIATGTVDEIRADAQVQSAYLGESA